MKQLHIISHTHWDREWYRTFQQFRLQLVHLIDNLLVILEDDPNYLHYMLDGQTVVLEDYLRVRMENFAKLQKYIQENRILIGPWYILPDEFLVSPESTVRNLLIGKQICELFGQRMMIGYLPDPFGHIAQMPQILHGFGIDTAALWRGVVPEMPTAFTWQAPDGSQVLLAHLYFGYGNISHWPLSTPEASLQSLEEAVKRLEPQSNTAQYLMMQGTDHLEPHPETSKNIAYYNEMNIDGNVALHSTLPAYFAALSQEIEDKQIALPIHIGELRDPQKAHLLPGVLSTRMWIKQRNWKAQNDLERWAEPFSAWAEILERGEHAFAPVNRYQNTKRIADPGTIIREAWKTLLKNHTHDSICGCSIDDTHKDMIPRFDKIDQINHEIQSQSLEAISAKINTQPGLSGDHILAITVFNAAPVAVSDTVVANLSFPDDGCDYQVVDEDGQIVACDIDYDDFPNLDSNQYTISQLANMIEQTREHGFDGKALLDLDLSFDDSRQIWQIDTVLSDTFEPRAEVLGAKLQQIVGQLASLDPDTLVDVNIDSGIGARLIFRAKDVPAFGYKTYWLEKCEPGNEGDEFELLVDTELIEIENDWLKISVDSEENGFSVLDKRNGKHYDKLGVLASVGDRGDEYNFTPTSNTKAFGAAFEDIYLLPQSGSKAIAIRFNMELPAGLNYETMDRSQETVSNKGFMVLNLPDDQAYVDIEFVFENQAMDHRLEMRFDVGFPPEKVLYDGHFDIVERVVSLPAFDASWSEHPRPEVPQRAFVDVLGENQGLMIANQGLPEVSVQASEGAESACIAITLLRSVGWLSRSDLFNRRGHAGPGLATPGAYELGTTLSTRLRLVPHGGQSAEVRDLAYAFQTELAAVVSNMHVGTLAPSGSMIEVGHPDFHITAIKEAEDQQGYVVRGVNLSDETIEVKLRSLMLAKRAARVMLDESFIQDLDLDAQGAVTFEAKAKEIVSVYFGLKA